ncbi:isopeptide-forming domain-containing fimbrial protein [Dellaglioa sp. P0083]|uniref:isopeptide-forming domain-containing fimbrial protein n=1 Tax=Dellaglioa kimchii TaxID=3344667 RepID=UPI0038D3901E
MKVFYKIITTMFVGMQVISSPLSIICQPQTTSAQETKGIHVLDNKDKEIQEIKVQDKDKYQLKISDNREDLQKMEVKLPSFLTYQSVKGLEQGLTSYDKKTNIVTFNLASYKISSELVLTLAAQKASDTTGKVELTDFVKNGSTSEKTISAKFIQKEVTKESTKKTDKKVTTNAESSKLDTRSVVRQAPEDVPDPPTKGTNIELEDTFEVIKGYDSYVHSKNKNEVVVNEDGTYKKGGLWYKNKINLKKDFKMSMYVYLGDKNGGNINNGGGGADGITFVMQNDPRELAAIGTAGAGLGAYGTTNSNISNKDYISKGLALEFDTFYNNGQTVGTNDGDVPETNSEYGHIAIQETKAVAREHKNLMLGTKANQLANGAWRKVNMNWASATNTLHYTVAGFGTANYKVADPDKLFGGSEVYWGFTGSTGTYTNYQAVAIEELPDQTKSTLKKDVKNITNKDSDYKTKTIEKKGDTVEYRLAYESNKENTQDLTNGEIKDVLDARHTYVPGSLMIDGTKQTDTVWNKGDIKLGNITPGTKREVVFQAKVTGTGDILNQGLFASKYSNPVESNKTVIYNGDATITKTDGDTGTPLKGVKYSLKDARGKVIKTDLTTDAKGQFDLHYLEPGDYTIEETTALPGYIKDTKAHMITITKDQKVPVKLDLKNYKEVTKPQLTKSASVKSAKLGDTYMYTLKVTNPSNNGTWHDVTMTDSLDTANLELVANSTTLDGKAISDATSWTGKKTFNYNVGNLKAGESKTVTFKVKVINIPKNKIIDNAANATGKDATGKEVKPDEAKVRVPVEYKDGQLASVKSVTDEKGNNINGKEVSVGDTIHFNIKVKNTVDNSIISSVVVKDNLIKAFAYKAGTLTVTDVNGNKKTAADTNFNGQNLKINVGDLKGQEEVTVGFDVTITADADGNMKNVALVSGTTPGGEIPEEPTPETDNTTHPKPTLKKSSDVTHVLGYGDTFEYTIKVGNEKGAGIWHNAQVTDAIKGQYLNYVAGSTKLDDKAIPDATAWNANTLSMKLGDLKAGESKTITFKVKVKAIPEEKQTVIPNTAKATGEDSKGNPVNPPESTVNVPVDYKIGELGIVKTVSDKNGNNINGNVVKIGDTLHFDVTASNISEIGTILRGIKVKDELVDAFLYTPGTLTVTQPDGTVVKASDSNFNGQNLKIDVGNLKGKESVTVGFDVTVTDKASGKLENVAIISGTTPEIPDTPTPPTTNYANPQPTLTKTSDVTETELGKNINYTLTSKNSHDAGTWHDASISDKLDTNYLEYVKGSTKVNGKSVADKDVWNGNLLKVDLGNVKNDQKDVVTFKVKVIAIPNNKVISNTVSATGNDSEGNEVSPPDATVDVPVNYMPGALKSLKTVSDAAGNNLNGQEVKVGDTLHFEIKVTNVVKDSIVTDVLVKDSLEKGFTYTPGTLKVNGKTVSDKGVSGQDISVNVGDLKHDETSVLSFDVKINEKASSDMTNVAFVEGKTPEGEVPPTPTPETNNETKPNPTLEKVASVQKTHLGETFQYTIKASNAKDAAKWINVTVGDKLDSRYLEYVKNSTRVDGKAVSDNPGWTANKLDLNIGDIETGESVSITFTVRVIAVPDNKNIANTASSTGEDSEGKKVSPPDASADVSVDYQEGKLKLDKAVSDSKGNNINNQEVKIGDTLHYDITAENTNEFGMIYNVFVKDNLVKGLEYKAGTLTVDGKATADSHFNGQNLNVNIGDLKGSQKVVVGFDVIVTKDADGKLDNVATGTGTTPDGEVPEVPTPETENPTNPKPSLEKTASQSDVKLGDTFTYTINARNAKGASTWHDAVVKDNLDTKHLELVANTTMINGEKVSDKEAWNKDTLTAKMGDIEAGTTKSVTFKVKVISDEKGSEISNTATGEGTDGDGHKVTPPDVTVTVPITKVPVVPANVAPKPSLEKTASQSDVKLGDTFTYTINAKNAKDAGVWKDAVVKDNLDTKHLELVANTTSVDGKIISDKEAWNKGTLTAKLGDLEAGATKTVMFKVKVIAGEEGSQISNTATGEGTDGDGHKVTPPNSSFEVTVVDKNTVTTPTPVEVDNNKSATPSQTQKELPQTGESAGSFLMLMGLGLISLLGFAVYRRRRD